MLQKLALNWHTCARTARGEKQETLTLSVYLRLFGFHWAVHLTLTQATIWIDDANWPDNDTQYPLTYPARLDNWDYDLIGWPDWWERLCLKAIALRHTPTHLKWRWQAFKMWHTACPEDEEIPF